MGGREPQKPDRHLFKPRKPQKPGVDVLKARLYLPDPLHRRIQEEVDSRQFLPHEMQPLSLIALLPENQFCTSWTNSQQQSGNHNFAIIKRETDSPETLSLGGLTRRPSPPG